MAAMANRTGLPHGTVPFHHLSDPQVRDVVMKLNENIQALVRRIAALEKKGADNGHRL